ncbi:hypothetical protein GW796_06035 [archaeon]|nr:hypothetical protein [archaeon]NCQ51444.1 hypothetical protein [archaeon]NCT58730.1 hypothetical protein [archaeon]
MPTYNFLSGSSIDSVTKFLFDGLQSGQSYLGFSRGEKPVETLLTPPNVQWGINSLVYVEYRGESNFEDIVATEGDTELANKFFDSNSLRNASCSGGNTTVSLYKVPNNQSDLLGLTPIYSDLKLNFIGKHWMLIEGIPKDYYTIVSKSASAEYYIVNHSSSGNFENAAKILSKSFVNVPYYSTECTLYSKSTSAVILTGVQRITNIIGESYVVGLKDPSSILDSDIDAIFQSPSLVATSNKTQMLNDTFVLKDVGGNVLIDNMSFVSPNNTSDEIYFELVSPEGDLGNVSKYVAFRYNYIDSEGQYIKFIVGNRQIDELGIWNEHLPFDSAIPSSDANPPGLEVSYLKNPLLGDSIFDIKGMIQINSNDVWFIKEMLSVADTELYTNAVSGGGYGFEKEVIDLNGSGVEHIGSVKTTANFGDSTIEMNNYLNFVVGDTFYLPNPTTLYTINDVSYEVDNSYITIDGILSHTINANDIIVSEPTSAVARITIAKTQNLKKALQYGFNSALINKIVDLSGSGSPTEDVYRQLFISYSPLDSTGAIMSNPLYKAPTYELDEIFNKTLLKYDIGTLLYLSNKIPIYRKYADSTSGVEEFKIIL